VVLTVLSRLNPTTVDLLADLVGPLEGGCRRQLDVQVEKPLILDRQESTGQPRAEPAGRAGDQQQEQHRKGRLADQHSADAHIPVGRLTETAVEPPEEPAQRAPRRRPVAQQQGRQGGAERERIEGRDDDRHRDGDGKLLVEPAGNARHEGRRHEHCGQDERDGHDRPRDLFHGLERGLPGREPFFNMMLDSLDHHDRVVHHQSDRQHETEQRQGVD